MCTKRFITALLFLLPAVVGYGQNFTYEEKVQGYSVEHDQVSFIFDEKLYGVKPEKVFVTGEFRNWDASTESEAWELKKDGEIWVLSIDNTDFSVISANSQFKYRINDGEWLQPPDASENTKGGNLVFMKGDDNLFLKAELRSEKLIWAEVSPERSLNPADYVLTDAKGNKIKVANVLPNGSLTTLIVPAEPLDIKRVYFLEVPSLSLKTFCSFDGWFREIYSSKPLGANIENGNTTVRLFAPRAEAVKLYLYKSKDDSAAYLTKEMKPDDQGVWEAEFSEDLHGVYYDFTVHGSDDPGNHFYETNPVHINDPYARVSDDTWGKGRIWRKTNPADPLKNGIPKPEDIVAYEVHVQDFTDRLPLEDKFKGTFKGMIAPGLKNSSGEKIGFDYLIDLGINVVHLMPVQEYVHFPDEDWKASFKDDPYMISQGISEENYQWGYRTSFAMAVESRYRTKGEESGKEREEFRDLVQAFHENDIAVIIDIVPNHTAENMTEEEWYFNFNAIDKQYYYRTKDFDHIGEYGNEVKTENRPMTQRWLIDQCLYFINEFGVDGFRIDLAGQIDQQTLIALKEAIGEDKILYGEAWIASNDPAFEENPDWDWYKEDAPITFFQDDQRNAYKGPVFELNSKEKDRGWAGGNFDERSNVMKGLANKFKDDKTPTSGISYLDIHDNFALADQFGTNDFDGRFAVDQNQYKIAVTLLYTTLGPIVTHGGSEIMRSKGHAPLKEVEKVTKAGYKQYMHGKRDTYNLRTANLFLWETVGQTPNKKNKNDYKNMYAFWQGMNRFRFSEYGKVFRVGESVPKGYYKWILPKEKSMLGYIVDKKVMVLLNAGDKESVFENVALPTGNWKLIADINQVNIKGVKSAEMPRNIKGGKSMDFNTDALSLFIWVNTE
jgi:pullulanase